MVKKGKIYQKTINLGDVKVKLYSLDGGTWSSNRDELENLTIKRDTEANNITSFFSGAKS